MSFWTNIVEGIKKQSVAIVVVLVFSVGGKVWDLVKVGGDVEFNKKVDERINAQMKDPIMIQSFLKQPEITTYVEKVKVESQKEIIKMSSTDSINFKAELRLLMDLRQSEEVSVEFNKSKPYPFNVSFTN